MIASVRGTLTLREPDGIVIDTNGGTGYLVAVPLGVFERLPAAGHEVQLYTELVVREDDWSLYGFDRTGEREVFRRLIGVSRIGPRLALAILSALGPDRTVHAVQDRDLAALASVPGIGRKTAERIALELRDRMSDLGTGPEAASSSPASAATRALINLGYNASAAESAVRSAIDGGASHDVATLVRRALADLTRGSS